MTSCNEYICCISGLVYMLCLHLIELGLWFPLVPGSLGSGTVKYVLLIRERELFDVPLWSTYVISLP